MAASNNICYGHASIDGSLGLCIYANGWFEFYDFLSNLIMWYGCESQSHKWPYDFLWALKCELWIVCANIVGWGNSAFRIFI